MAVIDTNRRLEMVEEDIRHQSKEAARALRNIARVAEQMARRYEDNDQRMMLESRDELDAHLQHFDRIDRDLAHKTGRRAGFVLSGVTVHEEGS